MNRLVTPEAVELDLARATVATRALGRLLDIVIQGITLLLVFVGVAATGVDEDVVVVVVALLAVFLVRVVYPVALETRFGATLGQRAMGLRIVTDDGGPIRLRQALVRAAVGLFEIELTSGLVAFLVAASRADGKRLGDVAAGTVAVSVRVGAGRADVLGVTCPPQLEPWARTLDTTGLRAAHRAALRRFHDRVRTLPPAQAGSLAGGLAPRLLEVLGATRPGQADDVEILRAVAWAAADDGTGPARAAGAPSATDGSSPPPAGSSRPQPGPSSPAPSHWPPSGSADDDAGFVPPS